MFRPYVCFVESSIFYDFSLGLPVYKFGWGGGGKAPSGPLGTPLFWWFHTTILLKWLIHRRVDELLLDKVARVYRDYTGRHNVKAKARKKGGRYMDG